MNMRKEASRVRSIGGSEPCGFSLMNGWNLHRRGGLLALELVPSLPVTPVLVCNRSSLPPTPPPYRPFWAALSSHLPSTEQKKRFWVPELPASKTFKLLMRILIN